jgi:tetratricopeptide (TPR) repeat protein
VPSWRVLFFSAFLTPFLHAANSTVLVVSFHNESKYGDLSWIGESISETLMSELGEAGVIVLDRAARAEGYRRLTLKSEAPLTKASLLKLGQTLDADRVCYGTFQIMLPSADARPSDGSIRINARFLDLRKLRDASEFSETGKLLDLSRLEEHLSWQAIQYLDPQTTITSQQLLQPSKLIRLDAKESYIRGLLATNEAQKQQWLQQAARLDPRYPQPAFQLGRAAFGHKDYRQAAEWFGKVPEDDPLYLEAHFRRGLTTYLAGDYATAEKCFRDLSQAAPLNEVFNNLGATESRLNEAAALTDLRRALEGDQTDPTYRFNVGLVLYRNGSFAEAEKQFKAVLERDSDDREAIAMLARCRQQTPATPDPSAKTTASERLKDNFDLTAFRQLKAMLQTAKQ